MGKEYHTWDTVTKKTVLPSAAKEYLAARDKPRKPAQPPHDIRLKFPASCWTCGIQLAVGTQVRWHKRGLVTGYGCCVLRKNPKYT